MSDVILNLVSIASSQTGLPNVSFTLDLTIGDTANANGSYTVTAAAGTYTFTDASGTVQSLGVSLESGSIDGADDELFLNGAPLVDLGGITFATSGLPNGATYAGSSSAYPQDINLFYTGSTTSLGGESFATNVYGIDTAPVTYLIQPVVNDIVNGSGSIASNVVIANTTVTNETIGAEGSTAAGASLGATVTIEGATLTGVLLDAQGASLIDVQAGSTVQDSTAEMANGGAIQFETAFSGAVQFFGAGDKLTLSQAGDLGPIGGFVATDAIDLTNLGFSTVSAPQYTVSNGDTSVSFTGTENGQTVTESLTFVGTQYDNAIQLQNDGDGGTSVITDVSCFIAGTLIRTPDGEKPIETLERGQLIVTAEGETRPVAWVGRRMVSALACDPVRCWPVRVMAHALGETVPSRDLLLSPDHALLVDDVLIHAGALVNGTSIIRETRVPRVFVYYHVELDDHSLILADNAPAETFIDNVDRMGFDNWAEHEALYPDGRTIAEMPYPRAKARRQVPLRVRALLDERARRICVAEILAA